MIAMLLAVIWTKQKNMTIAKTKFCDVNIETMKANAIDDKHPHSEAYRYSFSEGMDNHTSPDWTQLAIPAGAI